MAAKINSRSKGQRGEREIIDILQPHCDEVSSFNGVASPFLQRNQLQSHAGGYDVVGLPGFAMEIKRVEKDTPGLLATWWAQAVKQAAPNEEPVLFFRMNNRPWKVKMFTRLDLDDKRRYKIPSVISLDHFIFYMKARLHCHQIKLKQNS